MSSNHKSVSREYPDSLQLHFGVSGLNNSSMIEHFFPEDLPEDWRLSYYSNEFQLLLISLLDLNVDSSSSAEEIIEQLEQFNEELEEDFLLWLDISLLPKQTQETLEDYQSKGENHCHFINKSNMNLIEDIHCSKECEYLFIEDIELIDNEPVQGKKIGMLCLVNAHKEDLQKINPLELRRFIENIREYGLSKDYGFINVIFSSSQHALENCRNAILLESMM